MIKRHDWAMLEDVPDGEFVLYTDHLDAIEEKDKEIARLKAELKVAYAINKQNITVYDADTLLKEEGDG